MLPRSGRALFDLEHVLLWTRALTGLELTGGGFRWLEPAEWGECRRRLEERATGPAR